MSLFHSHNGMTHSPNYSTHISDKRYLTTVVQWINYCQEASKLCIGIMILNGRVWLFVPNCRFSKWHKDTLSMWANSILFLIIRTWARRQSSLPKFLNLWRNEVNFDPREKPTTYITFFWFYTPKDNINSYIYTYRFTYIYTQTYIQINTYTHTHIYIHRVIQEESARLREMIVCVILSKKVHMNMGPVLNGYGVMTAWNLE